MAELVQITCCKCRVVFGLNRAFYEGAKQAGPRHVWVCPNGHEQHFPHGPSDVDKLRKALETQTQQNAMWREDADRQRQRAETAERSAAAQRGVVTRLKNRAAAGVCPCCNRTFTNLARHMASKHAGFRSEDTPND